MGVVPDEVAVRQLFDQLTAGQPDAPPDRHSRIRRRVRRHRLARVAGTLAVAAAAAAVAVGVGTSVGTVPPATGHRAVPAWALPWPDHRDGSVPQRVLDGAVTAWRHEAALNGIPRSATSKAKVIWYAGQKVANGEVVVVIFEADSGAGRRLVAGWATASEVLDGQPGWKPGSSPWVLYDVAAPKPGRGLFVGLNMHGTSAQPGRNPDNWIVVLTAPDVERVGWAVVGPAGAKTTSQGTVSSPTARAGMSLAVRGLVVADVGQIAGAVQITKLDVGRRNVLPYPSDVGVPGSADSQVPQLARPAQIHGPRGFRWASELTGQGTSGTGLGGRRGHLAILGRCYGPSRLRLMFGTGAQELRLGTIRCDNAVHELTTQVRLQPNDPHAGVTIYTSMFTSYRLVIGTIK